MCNAMAIMQGIQMGMTVAGGVVGGYSAQKEGQYGEAINKRNATIAESAAGDAYARGTQAEAASRLKWGQLEGSQRTALASANVDIQSGTALDILADTAMMSEYDSAVLHNNAAREAWGYMAQASQYRALAKLATTRADYATAASLLGATSAGASGVAQTIASARK